MDLAFLTDLTGLLDEFNLELRGEDKDEITMISSVNTFKASSQVRCHPVTRGNPHMQAEL